VRGLRGILRGFLREVELGKAVAKRRRKDRRTSSMRETERWTAAVVEPKEKVERERRKRKRRDGFVN